ncbi:MAG: serine/threonine-protein phosphatase [Streptosporangiaceae bacterium]|nr:serine/threonine-protein phosphatase [Streptosporangiaceae bacterium]MBV9854981.1 serine/threonine-protein phosphatase [Streptosporangiaceae bacterium]
MRIAGWPGRWLELCSAVLVAVVVIICAGHMWTAPLLLEPLLAVPPALAGIGAATVYRPLGYGAASLLAAVIVAAAATGATRALPAATIVAVVLVTAVASAGTAIGVRKEQRFANVISVAEAAQRAVLRPLPPRLGPLELGVVYLAAAADAQVGGDLYEVVRTPFGIRMIVGDVRGKGLGAVEVAADVLGVFREVAHEVHTLAELARRLDAGLSRRWGEHEEFVTALFVEIEPEAGRLTVYTCGHPPPMLMSPDGEGGRIVTVLEVPAPAPPLGMLTLGDSSGAGRTLFFKPNDQLLLYTDGVTEARDREREFYPLDKRLADLGVPDGDAAGGRQPGLLELLREDLLRYSGAPLKDDAALLLVRAPQAWPAPRGNRAEQAPPR